ncbi:hypothetical protein JKP88DRAFT_180670, partial [Tribonema minus]
MHSTIDVAARVDCLFDDGEYYRGSVAAANADGTYRIVFDDGDIRHDAPLSDLLSPLLPGTRVSCYFPSEADYFPGVIGADNGDGTYHIRYDDGDELESASRRDIR